MWCGWLLWLLWFLIGALSNRSCRNTASSLSFDLYGLVVVICCLVLNSQLSFWYYKEDKHTFKIESLLLAWEFGLLWVVQDQSVQAGWFKIKSKYGHNNCPKPLKVEFWRIWDGVNQALQLWIKNFDCWEIEAYIVLDLLNQWNLLTVYTHNTITFCLIAYTYLASWDYFCLFFLVSHCLLHCIFRLTKP